MSVAPDYDGYVIRPSALPPTADCMRRTAGTLFSTLISAAGFQLRELTNHVGANVGSGVHTGASKTLEHKRQHGDLGSESDAFDAAIETFDGRCKDEGVTWDTTTTGRNVAHTQIKRMTRRYRKDTAPTINPVLVEDRLEAEVSPGILISGQMDALTMEPGKIRDLKTGTLRRANGAQYGAYAMLAESHGYQVDKIVEDYLARVRTTKEQPPVESTEIPVDVAKREAAWIVHELSTRVYQFHAALEQGSPYPEVAFPANPYSNLCSDRFCPAWGTKFCRAHLGAE